MDKYELEKVPEDSPDRCQATTKLGQCPNKIVPNSQYCPIHISAHNKDIKSAQNRIYNSTLWKARIHQHADHPKITSLAEEVGILRILIENILDLCKQPTDLIMHTNQISELTVKIQRLVKDFHGLEKSTGNFLDKTTIIKIAGDIVDIISRHLDDKILLERISSEIIDKVMNALPSEDDD